MRQFLLIMIFMIVNHVASLCQNREPKMRQGVPLDSIRLSDPFIFADKLTSTYYMTGTGGFLWKSKDLKKWTAPLRITRTDPESWMGKNPMITVNAWPQ